MPLASAQEIPLVTLTSQHAGRDLAVSVNGRPVTRADAATSLLVSRITPWLRDGANEVRVARAAAGDAAALTVEITVRGEDAPLARAEAPPGTGEWTLVRVTR